MSNSQEGLEEYRDLALEEYREIGMNLRHYGNLQWVNLTLSLATQAGLLTTIIRTTGIATVSDTARAVVAVIALGMIGLFYVSEHRLRAYWAAYFHRAQDLEGPLGFRQHRGAPGPARLLSSSKAIRAVYALAGLFWACTLFFPAILR